MARISENPSRIGRVLLGLAAGLALAAMPRLVRAQPSAAPADCAPQGDIQFVCGQSAAEDLVPIPGTHWLVTSGLTGPGGLRLIDTKARSIAVLFPAPNVQEAFDRATYDDCPGPLDAGDKARFLTQGLALGAAKGGHFTLYAVHRGDRESIEVFDLDPHGQAPLLTWIGCVAAPNDWVRLNSVVPLPGGGLVATNLRAREGSPVYDDSRRKLAAGEDNGFLWEWHTGKGWRQLPGSAGSGLNGIEVSKDGKWLFVDAWGSKSFLRLSRGIDPPRRDSVAMGFRIDNVRFAPDGRLIAAGQTGTSTRIVTIDPATLAVTTLLDLPNSAAFSDGSVAIPLDGALWVGSFRSNRVAIIPAPR